MAAKDNTATIKALHGIFNTRSFDRIKDYVDEDAKVIVVPMGTTYQGVAGFREYMENWATSMPDSKTEILNLFADGDRVAVEFRGWGTQTGPMKTPQGTIPPTGKHGELHLSEIYDFKNGKLVGMRTYFDVATLMRQLGLMP